MAFSGALTLTDLNDFITPSQACIKPVEQTNQVEPVDPAAAATQIHVDSSGSYYEIAANGPSQKSAEPKKKLETAQVSLNDCLACSGCITSAESVLITLQSHTEVLNFLGDNPDASSPSHKTPVLSIAPQSLASLAASVSSSSSQPVSVMQVLRRVEVFCTKVLGFEHVYDTTFARHIALLEHAQEFSERKAGEGKLPMLASACPGWVCYAEKTHAEMLPFISRTKSPQQVMGTLVKEWLGAKWSKRPDEIYHITVMPCYDKKLEASRQDFYNEIYATRDVDCVITTGELELLMREKEWDLSIPVPTEDPLFAPCTKPDFPALLTHPGTSSGSYLHSLIAQHMLAAPSLVLSVKTVRTADYEEYTLTDPDTGAAVFRGAKCYGFRNLQNIVRKVGRDAGIQVGRGAAGRLATMRARGRAKKADGSAAEDKGFDYVEVMACPGGCVNGGGQLRPPPRVQRAEDEEGYARDWSRDGVKVDDNILEPELAAKWGDREWTKKVEETYWAGRGLPTPPPSPKPGQEDRSRMGGLGVMEEESIRQADRLAALVLNQLCRPTSPSNDALNWPMTLDEEAEARRVHMFRTQYRAVESEVIGLAVKW